MSNQATLKSYPKGVTGNPGGKVRLPADLRKARRENMEGLIKLIHRYMAMTHEEAQERLAGPDALQLEIMIQGQIMKATTGDANSFRILIELMCGKVPESDEQPTSENMTPEEKLELMEKATAALRAQIGSRTPGTSDRDSDSGTGEAQCPEVSPGSGVS